jgi:C4-dicarboxylate-binding protein DctP
LPYFFCSALGFLALVSSALCAAANLHISTENTPRHFQTQHLERFASLLSNRLDSHRISVLDSAQAFRDRDLPDALSNGKIAMGVPGIWHLGRYVPDVNALLLPAFMGRKSEELHPIVDGPLGAQLNQALEAKLDVVVIGGWLDLGPAHIFTKSAHINSFSDLKGLKIRYPGGSANSERLKRLGANPILIPWPNVLHALENDQMDGLLTTASTVASARLWQKGISHAFLSYSYYPFYIPMMSRSIWVRLSTVEQRIIIDTWQELLPLGRKAALNHQKASLQKLRDSGINIITPTRQASAETREKLMLYEPEIANMLNIKKHTLSLISMSASSDTD